MLNIQNRQEGNTIIVTISGKIVLGIMQPLNALLQEIFSERRPRFLVLNLEEVYHLDSSGVGLLVASRNILNRSMGQLYLCGLRPPVANLLAKMNLLNYFSVCATEQEALQGIQRLSHFEGSEESVHVSHQPLN